MKKVGSWQLAIAYCLLPITNGFSQTAGFSVDVDTGCSPLTVNFTNNSTGADSYYWDFDDGLNSAATNPTHIYYGEGTYNVTLYAYDSLMNVDSTNLTISIPSGTPYFNLISQACPGKAIQFYVSGNSDSDNAVFWNFGDGFTGNNSFLEHAFSDTGIYNVTLTVTNSACGTVIDSNEITITNSVIPPVHIHPEYADTVICPGENFPFFYDEDLSIFWDFGDGYTSSDPYPTHSYLSPGIYTVIITVTNECGNTNSIDTTLVVDSNAIPVTNFSANDNTLCPGQETVFNTTPGSGYTYLWDFGDGNPDSGQVVTHSFADTGTYNVLLTVINACGNRDSIIKPVTVTDTLSPYGSIFISFLEACPGEEITFICPDKSNAAYLWFFGDGDTSNARIAIHTYTSAAVYPVQLVITSFCGTSDTLYDTVTIDTSLVPQASFILSQSSYCPGNMITFTSNNGDDIVSYFWEFGDGVTDTLKNTTHSYTDTGSYDVSLVVINLCGNSDTLTRKITVDTNGTATAMFNSLSKVCPGDTITFINLSSDTGNCVWVFGDGDTSISANPVHIFMSAGNYIVKLSVTNSCGNSSIATRLITVTEFNSCIIENIEEFSFDAGSHILIYPNPGNGIFSLNFEQSKILNLTIYNILGQVIETLTPRFTGGDLRTDNYLIDMTGHTEGIYTIRINTREKTFFSKFILVK